MSITITTKYCGATNTKGSRIRASYGYGKPIYISYPYELSGIHCHWKAAKALLEKHGVSGFRFVAGELSNGYVFCQIDGYLESFTI
jgi:hypothetical protein